MPSSQEFDLYDVSGLLAEDEILVRDQVRAWVEDQLMPQVSGHWEAGTFPEDLIPAMGKMGLLGPCIPEEFGGAGLGSVAYGLICQEIERADSGVRSFVSVQGSLVMYPIFAYGSESQKKQWLPKLARGEAVGCFGLTEPDFGSDPGGMLTRCRRDGEDWIIQGRKRWITNGSIADVAVVWAKDEDDRVQGFLVEKNCPGFSAPEQEHKWSLRCSVTSELILDDVRIPESSRLPGAQGLKAALACLTQARYGIAWGALGAAQACLQEARRYSLERQIFDKPLAGYQLTQEKLANMVSGLTQGQLLAWRLGRLKEADKMESLQVSLAKRANVRMALDVARSARTILGANGISLEYHAGRHACNLETVLTYEGTEEIHTLILGQAVTGLAAFRA